MCPTPETLAHLREVLHEPSTVRSQAVLAHWTDQLGASLDEREERERLATATREREEKEKEEREAASREEERKETVNTKTEAGDEEKGEDVEARRVSPARASERQTSTAEYPRSRDHLAPVTLRRQHAPALI